MYSWKQASDTDWREGFRDGAVAVLIIELCIAAVVVTTLVFVL